MADMRDVDQVVDGTMALVRRLGDPVGGFAERFGRLGSGRGMAG
jgi:hypothetical protein